MNRQGAITGDRISWGATQGFFSRFHDAITITRAAFCGRGQVVV